MSNTSLAAGIGKRATGAWARAQARAWRVHRAHGGQKGSARVQAPHDQELVLRVRAHLGSQQGAAPPPRKTSGVQNLVLCACALQAEDKPTGCVTVFVHNILGTRMMPPRTR